MNTSIENTTNGIMNETLNEMVAQNAVMNNLSTIITLSKLCKKVAFVKGNRAISKKNLSQKIASIKENGQLMPVIVVEGKAASDEGLVLVDCSTNEEIASNEVANYIVIIEGQHRYTAITMLQQEDIAKGTNYAPADIMVMYALNPKGKSVKKLISELNRTSIIWDGKDYVTGAALCNPTNELLEFAKELVDLKSIKAGDKLPNSGYPISSISKYLTFGSLLDKDKLAKCMDEGTECLPSANIPRAMKILETARKVGFKDNYLSHKYFIDWIIDECNVKGFEEVMLVVEGLAYPVVEEIIKIKGDNSTAEIRKVVTKYYDNKEAA